MTEPTPRRPPTASATRAPRSSAGNSNAFSATPPPRKPPSCAQTSWCWRSRSPDRTRSSVPLQKRRAQVEAVLIPGPAACAPPIRVKLNPMSSPAAVAPESISPALAIARRYVPWLVAVALFMENLDATIVNTAVPTMAESLGVAPLSLKGVLTSYTLSLAIFIPVSGWFADRFGTKRVFTTAIWLFLAGSLGCGLAPNVPLLVVARVLQGLGGAMMTPVGRLTLVRTFPRSEMLRTMNYVIIPALLGPLLGPFTGGVIVHFTTWRMIFFVNIPLALFGLWMTHRYMPDYRDEKVAPLDRVGFVLFCTGIGLLFYVLEVFGDHTHSSGPIVALTAVSLTLLAAYGWHARRLAAP